MGNNWLFPIIPQKWLVLPTENGHLSIICCCLILRIYLKILKPLGFCSRLHNTDSLLVVCIADPGSLEAVLSLGLRCQGDT